MIGNEIKPCILQPRSAPEKPSRHRRRTMGVFEANAMPTHVGGKRGFHVHGWRWHHLGVVQDLRQIAFAAQAPALCAAGGGPLRKELAGAFEHVLDDNWGVHDDVEDKLFFPWVRSRAGGTRKIALAALTARRRAGARRREDLRRDLAAFGRCKGGSTCTVHANRAASGVTALADEAAALFAAEEKLLVPLVTKLFSRQEQATFNKEVIRSLSSRQARVSLVVFRDAVQSSPKERSEFEREVPAPVRVLVPYWRRKFAHIRNTFFGVS